jgi:hypothetical protein
VLHTRNPNRLRRRACARFRRRRMIGYRWITWLKNQEFGTDGRAWLFEDEDENLLTKRL